MEEVIDRLVGRPTFLAELDDVVRIPLDPLTLGFRLEGTQGPFDPALDAHDAPCDLGFQLFRVRNEPALQRLETSLHTFAPARFGDRLMFCCYGSEPTMMRIMAINGGEERHSNHEKDKKIQIIAKKSILINN